MLAELIELLAEADKKVGGVMVELTVRLAPNGHGVAVGRVRYGMKDAAREFDGVYGLKTELRKLAGKK